MLSIVDKLCFGSAKETLICVKSLYNSVRIHMTILYKLLINNLYEFLFTYFSSCFLNDFYPIKTGFFAFSTMPTIKTIKYIKEV